MKAYTIQFKTEPIKVKATNRINAIRKARKLARNGRLIVMCKERGRDG